eukprot:jgi/Tetstr1/447012/TSEL_034470.t1
MEFAMVPDMVKQFVGYFYRHIRERNLNEIYSMYDVSFAKLSDRYFKGTNWPAADVIAELVDHDHVFLLLYKEMYFRHMYATTQPKLSQRCESWENYCNLFRVILHGNVNMQLPNEWLWDMIDEFIYQFQAWCQYRLKPSRMPAQELEALKGCDNVWNVIDVTNYLQALVDKSGIVAELKADGGAKLKAEEGYGPQSNVLRMLGYFSLVGLQRVHSLIGDYDSALKALYPIVLQNRSMLYSTKIPGCNITAHYYSAFAYIMLKRYNDASKILNSVLSYVVRVKGFLRNSSQYDQILKKNEQMYAMLAITAALAPASQRNLDENVANLLREKHNEKIAQMTRGTESVYDELFSYACPKFVAPRAPDFENALDTNQSAYLQQLKLFLTEIRQQQYLATIKQYLKLYTSISLSKLAALMNTDESAIRTHMMTLKLQTSQKEWAGEGDATEGVWTHSGDIDFYVDVDPTTGSEMVIVTETDVTKRHGDFLARHILKLEDIQRDLSLAQPVQTTNPAAAVYV